MIQQKPLIGAHVSAAGGVDKAIERAATIGCNCVQVFSGSPRVWARPDLSTIDAEKVSSKQKELSIAPIITHSLYLINLASDNPELITKSLKALSYDLSFDALLHGGGIVVHLGSHQGRGWDTVKEQVAKLISQLLEKAPPKAHFLMENAAAKNGKVGGKFEELAWLIDTVKSPQLGWCIDTCHSFTAGYALDPKAPHSAIEEMERLGLTKHLKCVHVNDSRDPFDCGRDRHANLGEGEIPQADMKAFLNHTFIKDLPLILEVPGEDNQGPDAVNVERLKALVA